MEDHKVASPWQQPTAGRAAWEVQAGGTHSTRTARKHLRAGNSQGNAGGVRGGLALGWSFEGSEPIQVPESRGKAHAGSHEGCVSYKTSQAAVCNRNPPQGRAGAEQQGRSRNPPPSCSQLAGCSWGAHGCWGEVPAEGSLAMLRPCPQGSGRGTEGPGCPFPPAWSPLPLPQGTGLSTPFDEPAQHEPQAHALGHWSTAKGTQAPRLRFPPAPTAPGGLG